MKGTVVLLSESRIVQDTTAPAAFITAIGVIAVAVIGYFTAKVSSENRKEAKGSSDQATQAAESVKGYVLALKAKDDLIETLERRVKHLETENKTMIGRLEALERRG